jgi:hypothetical protein
MRNSCKECRKTAKSTFVHYLGRFNGNPATPHHDLCDPAIVSGIERLLRLFEDRVCAAARGRRKRWGEMPACLFMALSGGTTRADEYLL